MVLEIRPTGMDVGDRKARILFAPIDADQQGDNEVVAAVTGKSIVVLHVLLIAEAQVTVKFCDDVSGDLTGPMCLAARGGFSDDSAVALFAAAEGEALNINLSAAEQVGGYITYYLL